MTLSKYLYLLAIKYIGTSENNERCFINIHRFLVCDCKDINFPGLASQEGWDGKVQNGMWYVACRD